MTRVEQMGYKSPIPPAGKQIDPIWWITGGLTSLLVVFALGYSILGVLV